MILHLLPTQINIIYYEWVRTVIMRTALTCTPGVGALYCGLDDDDFADGFSIETS